MKHISHTLLRFLLLPILALLQSCSGQKITVVPEMVVVQTLGPGSGSATALFDGNTSIWTAIKMREFYALQEEVLDRCEDAAKTIEEILIENS